MIFLLLELTQSFKSKGKSFIHRSAERRVGKECVSTCRCRGAVKHTTTDKKKGERINNKMKKKLNKERNKKERKDISNRNLKKKKKEEKVKKDGSTRVNR